MPRLKLRRKTSGLWIAENPILAEGEPAIETDTGKLKIGDGVTDWNTLRDFTDRLAKEAGYIKRTTTFTTTNTLATGGANGLITGLALPITGKGRPVELRLSVPAIYHSVANAFVACSINTGNPLATSNSQLGSDYSPLTNNGPSLEVSLRTDPLNDGQLYNFQVNVWSLTAGTCSLVAAAYCPIEFSAVQR